MLGHILGKHPAIEEDNDYSKQKRLATEAVLVVKQIFGVNEHSLKDWFVEFIENGELEEVGIRKNKIPRLDDTRQLSMEHLMEAHT